MPTRNTIIAGSVISAIILLTGCNQPRIVKRDLPPITLNDINFNEDSSHAPSISDEWKTSENRDFGVMYSYPSDWREEIHESAFGTTETILLAKNHGPDFNSDPTFPDAMISIRMVENLDNLELQERFDSYHQDCLDQEKQALSQGEPGGLGCPGATDTSNWKAVMVDGQPGLQSGLRGIPEGRPLDSVYIQLPGKFLVLSTQYYDSYLNHQPELELIFQTFLDDFRFLDKENSTPQNGWITQEDKDLKISYSFPAEWKQQQNKLEGVILKSIHLFRETELIFPSGFISINLLENSDNLSPQSFFDRYDENCQLKEEYKTGMTEADDLMQIQKMGCPSNPNFSEWEKMTIDGKEAFRLRIMTSSETRPLDWVVIHLDGQLLTFLSQKHNPEVNLELDPKLEKIFNRFLAEFKFLSPSS